MTSSNKQVCKVYVQMYCVVLQATPAKPITSQHMVPSGGQVKNKSACLAGRQGE